MRKIMIRIVMKPSEGRACLYFKWFLLCSILIIIFGCTDAANGSQWRGKFGDIDAAEAMPSGILNEKVDKSEISLRISANNYKFYITSEINISADLCNSGSEVKLIYEGFRWGVGRGVVIYKRIGGKTNIIDVQHSIPPPQSVLSLKNYRKLNPGECINLTLSGVAQELLGGPGVYRLMARGIPYVNNTSEFEEVSHAAKIWTLEQGFVESNVIEIVVENLRGGGD